MTYEDIGGHDDKDFKSGAPKGRSILAQGNALGNRNKNHPALKGRPNLALFLIALTETSAKVGLPGLGKPEACDNRSCHGLV